MTLEKTKPLLVVETWLSISAGMQQGWKWILVNKYAKRDIKGLIEVMMIIEVKVRFGPPAVISSYSNMEHVLSNKRAVVIIVNAQM